jgi:glyceraldehyde 3-phosphate dehydrogenase
MIKVFINGFGRIGRCVARIILEDEQFELVGVNDIYDIQQMKQLFANDSIYGKATSTLENVKLFSQKSPPMIECDVLLQCSGVHLSDEANQPFLKNGAKKVIISAPASDEIPTYIYGVNHQEYQDENIISNSSCSANAIVPIFDIIQKNFGIKSANLSMYHSYTAYQKLLDVKHYSKDIRRARSATQNIIPLESSAANATSKFFPHLKDKLYAKSIRVPVSATTFYDLSIHLAKRSSNSKMLETLQKEVKSSTILDLTDKPLVSRDFIQNPYSATIDLNFTQLLDGDLLRVSAWQDNEYGYAKRLADMVEVVTT